VCVSCSRTHEHRSLNDDRVGPRGGWSEMYVSTRQHTSVYVSIHVRIRQYTEELETG
jgi:hypothetical protein